MASQMSVWRPFADFGELRPLPPGVNAEGIESTTKDGVLEVTIPLPKAE